MLSGAVSLYIYSSLNYVCPYSLVTRRFSRSKAKLVVLDHQVTLSDYVVKYGLQRFSSLHQYPVIMPLADALFSFNSMIAFSVIFLSI